MWGREPHSLPFAIRALIFGNFVILGQSLIGTDLKPTASSLELNLE